ncbi:SDR family oxidoreductase [Patescibacteria group bacterium]|nr:SDR family oxidoreductase [Patescibacteria group bacterium]
MFNLKDKVAVITGAAGGLGESMAIALSKQGAKIAIFDIKDGQGTIKKLKTKSKFYKVDMSNDKNIEETVNLVKKDFGKIDILINNAGVFYPTIINSTKKEEWEKLMAINVTGYFLMAKYCTPKMKSGGRIINVASVAGHHAFAASSAYNASKGAVISLTKSMAMEYAPKNINVNAICPGFFVTPMTQGLAKTEGIKTTLSNAIPLKRSGKSEELGGLAVYLSSDECSYMTGSIINIDGGWTCHL